MLSFLISWTIVPKGLVPDDIPELFRGAGRAVPTHGLSGDRGGLRDHLTSPLRETSFILLHKNLSHPTAPQSAQEVDLSAQLSQAPVTHAFLHASGLDEGKGFHYKTIPVLASSIVHGITMCCVTSASVKFVTGLRE